MPEPRKKPRKEHFLWRDNSLTLTFAGLFGVTLVLQAIAGWKAFNETQLEHSEPAYSLLRYVFSSDFGVGMMENWQSEFLQFTSLIALAIWLRQRGSAESKDLDEPAPGGPEREKVGRQAEENSPLWARAGGWRSAVYANSLLAVMVAFFLASWMVTSLTGWSRYNHEQRQHQQPQVGWVSYLGNPDFWERTVQNWQSEFLAVASMSIFSVFLRQKGSPESKPVGAPHEETGSSG